MDTIALRPFAEINLDDPFFDSLKADYPEFSTWFQKKAQQGAKAYTQYGEAGLQAFLYLKIEDEPLDDIIPPREAAKRLKVGTFKIDAHNTKLGERFVKKITDAALYIHAEEIYVTIFPKHKGLITLVERYGFRQVGQKGEEGVWVKSLTQMTGNALHDFPLIAPKHCRKFVLSIYPKFHTRLFPESMLFNEQKYSLIEDVSHTNSIHKVYVSFIKETAHLTPGDLLVIYRTSDREGQALYRSVATSICQIQEVKRGAEFANVEDFIRYAKPHSVFSHEELATWYNTPRCVVLKMTYNIALPRRIIRKDLINHLGITKDQYWGFFPLSHQQFQTLIQIAEVNESVIIH